VKKKIVSKTEFEEFWKDSTREEILNQFYWEHIELQKDKADYLKRLNTLCVVKNSINLICFTVLAIIFNKWWIVFFSLIFVTIIENGDDNER